MIDLYNGDCLEIMKNFKQNIIDLTVTSPPYDNLRTYNGNIQQWQFDKFKLIAIELYRITKDGGIVVWVVGDATINGSETGTQFKQALWFKECGFNLHDTMIYMKNGTGACGSKYCYYQCFEYMFVFSKGRPKTVNRLTCEKLRPVKGGITEGRLKKDGTRRYENRKKPSKNEKQLRTNIWSYNVGFCSSNYGQGHPAVFPIELSTDHILQWSKENDIILDPFMGSGTTGISCVNTNRNFIGIELEKKYFDISKERIENAQKSNIN